MELSIVILNYQSNGLLKQCLRGLAAARIRLEHELIVVDNHSIPSPAAFIRKEFPQVRLIESPFNGGYAAGNNLGLMAARGRYVLILNPDIAVFPGVIEQLHAFLESHPSAAVVAPKLVNPDRTTQMSCYRFPDPLIPILRRSPLGRFRFAKRRLRSYLMMDWAHNATQAVDWVLGACIMVRMSAIERVGLFDERFFLYFEDVDWCRRFWDAGYQVYYVSAAELVHFHQRISAVNPGLRGILSATTRVHIFSGFLYFLKYGWRSPLPKHHEILP